MILLNTHPKSLEITLKNDINLYDANVNRRIHHTIKRRLKSVLNLSISGRYHFESFIKNHGDFFTFEWQAV